MSTQSVFQSAVLATAVLLPLAVAPSSAATKSANFQVLATIVSDCSVVSASNVDFGSVGVMTNDLDTISTVTIVCTPGTAYTVSLDAGTGAGSTITDRRMASAGGGSLKYQLFRNAARTENWGNTPGTDTKGGTGTGTNTPYTIYARLPAQAAPAVGSYTSTVTATVTY